MATNESDTLAHKDSVRGSKWRTNFGGEPNSLTSKRGRDFCGLSSHFSTRSNSKLLARADKLHVSTAMLQTSISIAIAARQHGDGPLRRPTVNASLSHKGSKTVGVCTIPPSERDQTMTTMFGLVFLQDENPKPSYGLPMWFDSCIERLCNTSFLLRRPDIGHHLLLVPQEFRRSVSNF